MADGQIQKPALLEWGRYRSPRCVGRCDDSTNHARGVGVAEKRAALREKGRIYITHPSFPLDHWAREVISKKIIAHKR